MRRILAFALAATVAAALSACGSSMHVTDRNSAGHFPASAQAEILIDKPLAVADYKATAYAQISDRAQDRARMFHRDMIQKVGFFDRVLTKAEFEQELVKRNLADKGARVGDLIELSRTQKLYGNFLVVDVLAGIDASRQASLTLTVIDPASGQTVFSSRAQGAGGLPLDQYFTYPVYNSLVDWLRRNGAKI